MIVRIRKAVILGLSVVVASCGVPHKTITGDFASMNICLSKTADISGAKLNVITDEPGNVSGKLSNGEHFGCKVKRTGTRGTYVEGFYTVKE